MASSLSNICLYVGLQRSKQKFKIIFNSKGLHENYIYIIMKKIYIHIYTYYFWLCKNGLGGRVVSWRSLIVLQYLYFSMLKLNKFPPSYVLPDSLHKCISQSHLDSFWNNFPSCQQNLRLHNMHRANIASIRTFFYLCTTNINFLNNLSL